MNIAQRPFLYVLVPVLALVATVSFYRFIVVADYTVEYEGECDPVTERCFVGCEDELCTEEYYYSVIERHATELRAQCGPDISECELAQSCPAGEAGCSIRYCDAGSLGEGESCEEIEPDVEEVQTELLESGTESPAAGEEEVQSAV